MENLTEQELFWQGDFGNQYMHRNTVTSLLPNALSLWSKVLGSMREKPATVLEMGCNIGGNLLALAQLLPDARLSGVEINAQAAKEATENLASTSRTDIHCQSLFEIDLPEHDFVFTRGVLIHINPEKMPLAYKKIYEASNRYVCLCEYYNTTPVNIEYRGHAQRLFKRDFAGEFMDIYPQMHLVDYGFCWHRDPIFAQDDLTWFLLEKRA